MELDYQKIINDIYVIVKSDVNEGQLASYIPELSKVDQNKFGVYLKTINGNGYGVGDYNIKFSIQSISKVVSLALAYGICGKKLWTRMGVEPSGTAFNSLVQLETDNGVPRNPFVNAGALVICDILISLFDNAPYEFLSFFRDISDNDSINFSKNIAKSERYSGHRNIALCYFLKSFGNIKNNPEEVLDLYFNICSVEMSCLDLSSTFLFLANEGKKTTDSKRILSESRTKRLNALMQTCGLYDEAGEFSFKVGLPGKSGVGGGIIAVHPSKYVTVVWSPLLNDKGNSSRGMKFLELLTTETGSSIF